MSVEYDLVIIGASPEGIYAAQQAIQSQKRVALVEQGLSSHPERLNYSIFDQITPFIQQYNALQSLGYFADLLSSNLFLKTTQNLIQTINNFDLVSNSLAALAASGIDVLMGSGSFSNSPQLSFEIDNRKLRSRNYLLATGSMSCSPEITGLESSDYLTPITFQYYQFPKIAQTWTIVGATPLAIQLAQYLSSLKQKVILITYNEHILPQEDCEVVHLLQAQLEAMGIQIITQAQIQKVKSVIEKKELFLEEKVIETDQILLASSNKPKISGLNLNEIKVKFNQTRVFANSQLQTTNPQIYTCGNLLGGYDCPEIAQYEVRVALNNIFSTKKINLNYSLVPYTFSTYPNFARIGLTETQARKLPEKNIQVINAHFKLFNQTQILDTPTGICKLIINSKQEIIGVYILGNHATELISYFSLVIQQKIKLNELKNINSPSPIFTEILEQLA